jgi:hypothetical protein
MKKSTKLTTVAFAALVCNMAVLGLTLPRGVAEVDYGVKTVEIDMEQLPFGMEEVQKDLNLQLGL